MSKPKLGVAQRKLLLTLHLIFAGIMLGVAVVFLILSITAASANDFAVLQACYIAMYALAESSVRASTIGTIVTGVLLSALTQWGLFRYYWIIAKEALTLVSIGLGPLGMYVWSLKAVTLIGSEGAGALQHPAFLVNEKQLWVGIILQIVSLASMFFISVYKPWGSRKSGRREAA